MRVFTARFTLQINGYIWLWFYYYSKRPVFVNIVLSMSLSRLWEIFRSVRIFIGSVSIFSVSNRAAKRPMKYKFCTCHIFYLSGCWVTLLPVNKEELTSCDVFCCEGDFVRWSFSTFSLISSCRSLVRFRKGSHRRTWPFIRYRLSAPRYTASRGLDRLKILRMRRQSWIISSTTNSAGLPPVYKNRNSY